MKGIQLGALWFSQNGLQCWDHVCHKRHPSSIFGALVFHAKNVSMLRRCLHSWGLGASRFSQKWATLRQSHPRSIIKIVDLHFTFQSEIPALAPCKMEVTPMIYVDCKSKYVRMVTTFQSQSKTERCLKVDQCSWVQLHKPHAIQQLLSQGWSPTSRSIALRLLPKEQRPLADPPWPGATSQAQKRCRTSGWSGF